MKKFMSVLLVGLLFVPMLIKADSKSYKDYTTSTLSEVLKEEGIDVDLGDYKESDDKINIYLFRGKGCSVCKKFVTFLAENIEEYGKYFNLVAFEVWYDNDNVELLNEVSEVFGDDVDGVPYIVIGDETFPGFLATEEYQSSITSAIMKLYESKDRYDVFDNLGKEEKETKDNFSSIILWNLFFTTVATIVILFVNDRRYKELNTKIDRFIKKNK